MADGDTNSTSLTGAFAEITLTYIKYLQLSLEMVDSQVRLVSSASQLTVLIQPNCLSPGLLKPLMSTQFPCFDFILYGLRKHQGELLKT